MAKEFTIPAVSEGVKSVDIATILVKEGDVIAAGTRVAEVETDKAATDLEVDFGGKVVKIHAKPGDTLLIGAPLLTIEEGSGAASSAAPTPAPAPAKAAVPTAAPVAQPVAAAAPVATPTAAPAVKAVAASSTEGRAPAPAGPATRRLARELGVDLYQVVGSAAGGRITQDDVKNFVKGQLSGGSVPVAAAVVSGGSGGGYVPPPLPDFSKFGPTERQALNKIAKVSAANLSMCWNVIPHVTQHDLVDITDLEAARKRHGEGASKSGDPKITMTAIAMKAVSIALKEFPKFNSSLDPQTNELVLKRYYNLGCAVDTPNGLLVPVIKNADQKSVSQIAAELGDIAGRARDNKLKLDEMQGATFTITNLGGIGGTAFTPIVNYPEVAILGMSRSRTELRLNDGQIEERLMLPLSLSYDHRVLNGADAARFIVRLGQLLSDYFHLVAHA